MSRKRVSFNEDQNEIYSIKQPRIESPNINEYEEEDSRNYSSDEEYRDDIEKFRVDSSIKIIAFNDDDNDFNGGRKEGGGSDVDEDDDEELDARKDNWLGDVDWSKVKENEARRRTDEKNEEETEVTESSNSKTNQQIYKEISEILLENETVLKALRRLGSALKPPPRNKRTKQSAKKITHNDETNQTTEDVEKLQLEKAEKRREFELLTELADSLIQQGIMEAYEFTRERLDWMIKSEAKPAPTCETFAKPIPPSVEPPSAAMIDMFDTATENKDDENVEEKAAKASAATTSNDENKSDSNLKQNETFWKVRCSASDGSVGEKETGISGNGESGENTKLNSGQVYSNQEMLQLTNQEEFEKKVYRNFVVKRCSAPDKQSAIQSMEQQDAQQENWYSLRRIDFELYE